jgi:hypothetical protein
MYKTIHEMLGIYNYIKAPATEAFTSQIMLMLKSADTMEMASYLLQLILDIGGAVTDNDAVFEKAWQNVEISDLPNFSKKWLADAACYYSTNGENFEKWFDRHGYRKVKVVGYE